MTYPATHVIAAVTNETRTVSIRPSLPPYGVDLCPTVVHRVYYSSARVCAGPFHRRLGHQEMATTLDLLSRGFFPREVPDSFTTASFAQFAISSQPALAKLKYMRLGTRCIGHNLARPGGLRRPLKIPNPFSYLALCEKIEQHWTLARTHFLKGDLSASRPRATRVMDRAVVARLKLGELPKLRARRWRGGRYFLKTDINQFYPSIYTHSIAWALHTKAIAKGNIGKKRSLPGDQLDVASRNLQSRQSVGIPIGPDTSLIIAEIVLTAVDHELRKRFGRKLRGFRYVDDYELVFGSLREAEDVLVELQGLLSDYELVLNPRKTGISEMPVPLTESWSIELSRFDIRKTAKSQVTDLIALFSRAFELAEQHPEQSVLRYAIRRAGAETINASSWKTFESVILDAVTVDPSTFATAVGVLSNISMKGGYKISKQALDAVISAIIVRHAPLGHGSEVAWALWAALCFGVHLSNEVATAVSRIEDDVVALLALDADSRGLFSRGALNQTRWAGIAANTDAPVAEHWLLAYEAHLKGWLRSPAMAANRLFSMLFAANVSFYDPARVAPGFPKAASPMPGGSLPVSYS